MDESPRRALVRLSDALTQWVGSPASIAVHTLLFAGMFLLAAFNVSLERILLVLTTAVSLEAIYLAIFIQMTVNRHTRSLEEVEEDIEELGEEVEDLSEDLEEIGEEIDEEQEEDERTRASLDDIATTLHELLEDVEAMKRSVGRDDDGERGAEAQ